jgi:Lar family restriction alleviation protein
MSKLKPCPFCGHKPRIGPFASAITIHCANEYCDVGVETSAITEAGAIEQWNKRAPMPTANPGEP